MRSSNHQADSEKLVPAPSKEESLLDQITRRERERVKVFQRWLDMDPESKISVAISMLETVASDPNHRLVEPCTYLVDCFKALRQATEKLIEAEEIIANQRLLQANILLERSLEFLRSHQGTISHHDPCPGEYSPGEGLVGGRELYRMVRAVEKVVASLATGLIREQPPRELAEAVEGELSTAALEVVAHVQHMFL